MTQSSDSKKEAGKGDAEHASTKAEVLKAFEEQVQEATKAVVIPAGSLDLAVVGDVLAVLKRIHNRIVEYAQKHMDTLKV